MGEFDPSGCGCAEYYRTFSERYPTIIIDRDEFDDIVRSHGYFMSRQSQLDAGREWNWRKI